MYNKKAVEVIVKEWVKLKTGLDLSDDTISQMVDDITEAKQCDIHSVSGRFYRASELNDIPFGLYKVYWKEEQGGGTSIASVGNYNDGGRWIAPTNWTGDTKIAGRLSETKEYIEKMEMLYEHGH